jgi:U4/U6.U5 tri-snRNP-associated protein 2
LLDFDIEKQCSVSLSTLNVYCCLVCGKYFQGKGQSTNAYMHSLQPEHGNKADATDGKSFVQHNMFIGLSGAQACKVFCLPDNYEVHDASLNDIKFNLKPVFSKELIDRLDKEAWLARSLEGAEFMPGCVGLNNLKLTDFANSIIQLLVRVKPLRNVCLKDSSEANVAGSASQDDLRQMLSLRFSELVKKVWNPRNFKGHVSPHEFMEAVSLASNKRFMRDDRKDTSEKVSKALEGGFGG